MTFDPQKDKAPDIFKAILWELQKKNRVIGSVVVDGQEVFNHQEEYVGQRLKDIKEIVVKSGTREELARENMDLIAHHLEGISAHLPVIGRDFRGGITQEGWADFEGVVNSLIFIEKAIIDIFEMVKKADKKVMTEKWGEVVKEYQKLNPLLKDLEELLDYNRFEESGNLVDQKMKEILDHVIRMIDRV